MIAGTAVIVPDRFVQRSGCVSLASQNDAPLFEIIVGGQAMLGVRVSDGCRNRCMIRFVCQTKRGRLPSAGGRTQCAVGIPMNRARVRIVRISVMRVEPQMNRVRRVL